VRVSSRFEQIDLRELPLDHSDALHLVAEVQGYYAQLYGAPDSGPIDPAEMASPQGAFFVGYLDGVPVLMGGWRFTVEAIDVPAGHPAELKRMYVVPAYRGNGLARGLLRHLEDSARAAGADAMVLETGRPQADAVSLYRASGYTDIPRFGHYRDEPDAVHLGKDLTIREVTARP
jgi:ribosomal protein S18 acetylase RimI-like enzyme